jgi:hypothetical protein
MLNFAAFIGVHQKRSGNMANGSAYLKRTLFFSVVQEPNLDPAGGILGSEVCIVYLFQF